MQLNKQKYNNLSKDEKIAYHKNATLSSNDVISRYGAGPDALFEHRVDKFFHALMYSAIREPDSECAKNLKSEHGSIAEIYAYATRIIYEDELSQLEEAHDNLIKKLKGATI